MTRSISGFISISTTFFSSPSRLLYQQSHTGLGYCNLPLGDYCDTNIHLPMKSEDNLLGCIKFWPYLKSLGINMLYSYINTCFQLGLLSIELSLFHRDLMDAFCFHSVLSYSFQMLNAIAGHYFAITQ